ncbi:MAG: HDOD domain-containing protein [Desulfobulbaceae bacterium]|nr:HDOD domain-containing protein [Desulfobulbaceae bacterium]
MTETKGKPSGKLAEIFAKINMSELPAMSHHVQELISLAHSSRSAANDLSRVILKDYSLTNKVLQVVNSAYYSLGQSVSSISRAVTILGFDAVRDLATAIAIFEDFIKSGVEKEGISKLMTRSFLSALHCQDIAGEKKLNVLPEEAFICGLLHNLGRIITFIYMPEIYKKIERNVALGLPEERATRELLEDITFAELGQEIAKYWNLSQKVVISMETNPAKPRSGHDTEGYLQNLADFSNRFVDLVCNEEDTSELLNHYGEVISINQEQALELLNKGVEASQDISDSIRYGLSKLKIHSRLEKAARREPASAEQKESAKKAKKTEQDIEELDELPSSDKSINDFIKEMTETLMGPFQLNEFYANLLEAIYRGVGFDRVILCVMSIQTTKIVLSGRFGLGDIDAADIANFEQPLANVDQVIPRAMKQCKDIAVVADAPGAFPDNIHYLVKGRTIYLFPIVVNNKAIALLYMDRKAGRPKLNNDRIKALRLFRDFAAMAIKKSSKKG